MANSGCGVCGFSTSDLSQLEKHMQEHDETLTPKIDFSGLMSSQSELLKNLPALFASYYPSLGFNSPVFKSADMEALLKAAQMSGLHTTLPPALKNVKVEPQTNAVPNNWAANFTNSASNGSNLLPQAEKKPSVALTSISPARKDPKSKKVTHSCPHCNFTTVMSQHMKSHLEAHERHQGQMYQCDLCHMQFSQKANMHRHRMRHSGFKPYECRYCKKRFFRKDQMQEHSMTHIKTGEDFDCPVANCDVRFRQHSSLRTHLDESHTITANEHAACKRCAMTFANSRRLLLHYQTKHDDTSNGVKRESEFSDEDGELSGTPAKRSTPAMTPTNTAATESPVPVLNTQFPTTPIDFLNAGFNWNALGFPLNHELSVAVSQALPVNLAATFSPQLLPKSEPPNCEGLFKSLTGTSALHEGLRALGSTNLDKLVEGLKTANPQVWANETNSTSGGDENSSTHSPSSDSRASSTPAHEMLIDESAQGGLRLRSVKASSPTATANVITTSLIDNKRSVSRSPPIDLSQTLEINEREDEKKNVEKEKHFECSYCGILFTDYMLYRFHKTLHASDNPWRCGLCARECSDRFEFTTHIVQDRHSN